MIDSVLFLRIFSVFLFLIKVLSEAFLLTIGLEIGLVAGVFLPFLEEVEFVLAFAVELLLPLNLGFGVLVVWVV